MSGLVDNISLNHHEYIDEINEKKVLSDELIASLKETIAAYVTQFENLQKAG